MEDRAQEARKDGFDGLEVLHFFDEVTDGHHRVNADGELRICQAGDSLEGQGDPGSYKKDAQEQEGSASNGLSICSASYSPFHPLIQF